MRRRQSSVGALLFLVITVIVLGGAWLYTSWRSSQIVLPPGLTINGLPMGGMTREQALRAIALAYTTPVTVHYESEVTLLLPAMVDLTLDVEATANNLDAALATRADASGFFRYVTDRALMREPEALRVSAVVSYSRARVDAFLARIAQRYDQAPQSAVPLPEAGTFRPPRVGTTLLVDDSRSELISAILAAAPDERQVRLVVEVEPAPAASVELLRDALNTSFQTVGAIGGVFVKDLRGGQEFCLHCQAAYSEVGLLKVGAAMTLYRALDEPLAPQARQLISGTLLRADHTVADQLLAHIGAGDPYSGAAQVTDFLWGMGLRNSFLLAPYVARDAVELPAIDTSATPLAGAEAGLALYAQTTPTEMGLLMESLYQCDRGGGMLHVIYAQEISAEACAALLAWMAQSPSWLGTRVMESTVASRVGWGEGTYAEAAVMYGTYTDVAVVVFLYHPTWLTPDAGAETFATVGRLVYGFFNGAP